MGVNKFAIILTFLALGGIIFATGWTSTSLNCDAYYYVSSCSSPIWHVNYTGSNSEICSTSIQYGDGIHVKNDHYIYGSSNQPFCLLLDPEGSYIIWNGCGFISEPTTFPFYSDCEIPYATRGATEILADRYRFNFTLHNQLGWIITGCDFNVTNDEKFYSLKFNFNTNPYIVEVPYSTFPKQISVARIYCSYNNEDGNPTKLLSATWAVDGENNDKDIIEGYSLGIITEWITTIKNIIFLEYWGMPLALILLGICVIVFYLDMNRRGKVGKYGKVAALVGILIILLYTKVVQ